MDGGLERRLLQAAVAVAACVPVFGGLAGALMGAPMFEASAADATSLDSHLRYLSGLLLGIGLTFWSLVPKIERAGAAFRLLTLLVVAGGLARLTGLVFTGRPSAVMLFALVMELVVTPLLCLWQARLVRR